MTFTVSGHIIFLWGVQIGQMTLNDSLGYLFSMWHYCAMLKTNYIALNTNLKILDKHAVPLSVSMYVSDTQFLASEIITNLL